ncbi:MAG: surface lipoprotein assembly modifier [Rhizobiaceae bacterium]
MRFETLKSAIGAVPESLSGIPSKMRLAALAATACLFAGPTIAQSITFDQVLASPDDIELNFAYAKQEAATGRLQQSAAALERILLNRPNYDTARLFYGIVLYRLADLEGAIRELTLLDGRELTPSQERDRRRYLALAQSRADPWRFSARYTLGGRIDSNPGRFSDTALNVVLAEEDVDGAIVGLSQFRVERDLENGRGDFLFFQSNGHINEFFDTDNADLIHSRAKLGASFHGVVTRITPYAYYSNSWLQHERFRSRLGGGLDVALALNSQVELHVKGFAVDEDYRVTDFSPVGSRRDGWYKSVRAGAKWKVNDRQSFGFSGFGARKDADDNGFDYDSHGIRMKSLSLLGEGAYLSLSAAYTWTDYDRPDNFLSSTITREDKRLYLRAAAGAPLETLFKSLDVELPESIGDVVAQIGVSYTDQSSTISLIDYDNLSVDVLFTKRLTF